MVQDLKNQKTIFEPDASRSGKTLKTNQPKTFHMPEKIWKRREAFCLLGVINGSGYTTTKLKTVYIASFVKTPTIITC